MKRNILKILMFIFVPIVFIIIFYGIVEVFKKQKPGLYFKSKCNKKSGIKLNNEGAQKALCEGLYIPYGMKLGKKDYVKVLEKMGELSVGNVELKKNMKKLAQEAVKQTI